MPKADATGLAPEESADSNPPAHASSLREGWASASAPRGCLHVLHYLSPSRPNQVHFFGEVSERRPWAYNAKTARPPLPGAPNPLFCSSAVGIPLLPIQASILSHSPAPPTPSAAQTEKESDKVSEK
jgi:hypothetical protein